jgi:putative hydrolase of the HAD superfamily
MWTAALLEVVEREQPGHAVTADQIRPYLQSGFPWHQPDRPHPQLASPDGWWAALEPVFEGAFAGLGFGSRQARSMARQVRPIYCNPGRWRLFDDALPTLGELSSRGWTHLILSNHVPELRALIGHLGLACFVDRVFNSAETGYEKPHPDAFRAVLVAVGDAKEVWMIGDSYEVDILGAEAAGIRAILVRRPFPEARYYCDQLTLVPGIVEAGS